jgi:1-acyl-sn-glycerol-3-phosphate acyltransferase
VSLGQSVDAVLRNGPITVHLYVGEAIEAGDDRRVLAAKAREAVEGALRGMQATVGKPANLESAVRSEALGLAAGDAGDAECGALDVSPTPRN